MSDMLYDVMSELLACVLQVDRRWYVTRDSDYQFSVVYVEIKSGSGFSLRHGNFVYVVVAPGGWIVSSGYKWIRIDFNESFEVVIGVIYSLLNAFGNPCAEILLPGGGCCL